MIRPQKHSVSDINQKYSSLAPSERSYDSNLSNRHDSQLSYRTFDSNKIQKWNDVTSFKDDLPFKKSLFAGNNRYKLTQLENRETSDTDSIHSSNFSSKNLMFTPRIEKSKFSPLHKVDFEKKMRNNVFESSQIYMGFSSRKRENLAGDLQQPDWHKSLVYKEDEPLQIFNHKTNVQRKCSNNALKSIRDYGDSRSDFLSVLGQDNHVRSSSSIFGLQRSSFH